jgi:hypothetical protein
MKFTKNTILIATAMLFVLTGCKKEEEEVTPTPSSPNPVPTVTVPTAPASVVEPATYAFDDFNGNSTVSYGGQTDRLDMLGELVSYIKTGHGPGESGTNATLDATAMKDMYSNKDATGTSAPAFDGSTGTGGQVIGTSTKDLKGKTAGDAGVQAVVEGWLDAAAAASASSTQNGYLMTSTGLEFAQAIEKGLMGACFAYQITANYLDKVVATAQITTNTTADRNSTKFYTNMEHYWDEAYGYYTSAINYPTAGTNRYWGKYANKSYLTDNIGSDEIVGAFRSGREAIRQHSNTTDATEKAELETYIVAVRDFIENKFRIMQSAMAIHYLRDVKTKVAANAAAAGTHTDDKINHAMSEAFAFTWGIQFIANADMTSAEVNAITDEMFAGFDFTKLDGYINTIATAADLVTIKEVL